MATLWNLLPLIDAIGQFHELMRSVDGMGSAAVAID